MHSHCYSQEPLPLWLPYWQFHLFYFQKGFLQEEISTGFPRNPQLPFLSCSHYQSTMHPDPDSQGLPNGFPNRFSNVGQTHNHSWSTILCCTCTHGQCGCCISKQEMSLLFQTGSVSMVTQRFAEELLLLRSHCLKTSQLHHRHVLCAPHIHNATVSQMTQKLKEYFSNQSRWALKKAIILSRKGGWHRSSVLRVCVC
jgi:hypothetical protein